MTYTVIKSSPVLVPPAGSTPSCTLSLSSINKFTNFSLEVVMIFSYGEQPTVRIKDAFAKALIHYYPVAGRIVWMKDEPVVDCTGEGIWFVEAVANCVLADVKYLQVVPHIMSIKELLPTPPQGVNLENQILMVQITEFMCVGFTLGIWMNHMIFDGVGGTQFLKATGETARGLSEPSVKPIWSRKDIPVPPRMLSDV
ncbi:hypothetical protein LUZ60_010619 [Juncus effusus]|nr:hypothetical protein LUZ60_010619 [Juncus effusus]